MGRGRAMGLCINLKEAQKNPLTSLCLRTPSTVKSSTKLTSTDIRSSRMTFTESMVKMVRARLVGAPCLVKSPQPRICLLTNSFIRPTTNSTRVSRMMLMGSMAEMVWKSMVKMVWEFMV